MKCYFVTKNSFVAEVTLRDNNQLFINWDES